MKLLKNLTDHVPEDKTHISTVSYNILSSIFYNIIIMHKYRREVAESAYNNNNM